MKVGLKPQGVATVRRDGVSPCALGAASNQVSVRTRHPYGAGHSVSGMSGLSFAPIPEIQQERAYRTLVSAFTDDPAERWLYPELPDYPPDGRTCHDHVR